MRMRLLSISVALLWAAAAQAGSSSEEARAWIKRMNEALVNRNYSGELTHRWKDGTENLSIIHRMRDGRMVERVISRDGSGHEILRNGTQYVRFYPEKRIALVETRTRSFGHIPALNGLNAESDKFYVVRDAGAQQLLGWAGPTQLILIEPRDANRYGYRIWLDRQNAMPIKTQMVTKAGEVIDDLSFTRLQLPESIPDDLLKPAMDTRSFRWMSRDVQPGVVKQGFEPRANLLPAGYRSLNFDVPMPGNQAGAPKTRFIVSDGISWVSVLVEAADQPRPEGPGQMGATAAYVIKLDNYYISAFGGVPPAVVKSIVEAVRPE